MVDEEGAGMAAEEGKLRDEIALSWRRSLMSGIEPTHELDSVPISDIDRRSRLLAAATPILDRLEADFEGTGYCVILADREARLVDLRYGQRTLHNRMDNHGAVLGRRFAEETTGTNSIATVFELRKPVAVYGQEHFVDSMKAFSCYGYPIHHPITRRLEGVLDITFLASDDSPLLKPILTHAANDLQQRLLEGSRSNEQALLRAFQETVARRRGAPVLALADDVLLANASVNAILDPVDHAILRAIIEQDRAGQHRRRVITLSSGQNVLIQWERSAQGGGVIIQIDPAGGGQKPAGVRPHQPVPRPRNLEDRIAAASSSRTPVLVSGEAGTGRTAALRQIMAGTSPSSYDAADLTSADTATWLTELGTSLEGGGPVTIENIHLLPDPVAHRVSDLLQTNNSWFALTSNSAARMSGEQQRITSLCRTTIDLQPLRSRIEEIPALVQSILKDQGLERKVRFTSGAIAALARHSWPGNLAELRRTVEKASSLRSAGDITESDLNGSFGNAADLALSALERAERGAIEQELLRAGGNKSNAAARLGISRTTLYKRMRALNIVG
jgi:sigma-54 dependent transcriptional regulator, acetoin dehydrogenase operon transcriptional activator AcoR